MMAPQVAAAQSPKPLPVSQVMIDQELSTDQSRPEQQYLPQQEQFLQNPQALVQQQQQQISPQGFQTTLIDPQAAAVQQQSLQSPFQP